jgi:hypothetical protein
MRSVAQAYDSVMAPVLEVLSGQRVARVIPRPSSTDAPALTIQRQEEESLWTRDSVAWMIAGGIYQSVGGDEEGREKERQQVLEAMSGWISQAGDRAIGEMADSLWDRVHLKTKAKTQADREFARTQADVLDWLIDRLPDPKRRIFVDVRKRKKGKAEG